MATPFVVVLQELNELLVAVHLDTDREYEGGDASALHRALLGQAARVAHETVRLTLVFRSLPLSGAAAATAKAKKGAVDDLTAATAVVKAATEVCDSLLEATTLFASAVQLATKPAHCGSVLSTEIRAAAHSLLNTLIKMLAPLAGDAAVAGAGPLAVMGVLSRAQAAHGDALLYHAGMVNKVCERIAGLPAADTVAVRRRLLTTARLIKTSASELVEEHEEVDFDAPGATATSAVSSVGDSGGSGAGAGATAAAAVADVSAGIGALSVGGEASVDSHDDHDDDADDDDECGDAFDEREVTLTPFQTGVLLRCTVSALRSLFSAFKHALTLSDAIAAPLTAATTTNTTNSGGGSSSSGSSGFLTGPTHIEARAALDDIGVACQAVNDAVIDVAAAVNEVEVEEIPTAVSCLRSSLTALEHALILPPPPQAPSDPTTTTTTTSSEVGVGGGLAASGEASADATASPATTVSTDAAATQLRTLFAGVRVNLASIDSLLHDLPRGSPGASGGSAVKSA